MKKHEPVVGKRQNWVSSMLKCDAEVCLRVLALTFVILFTSCASQNSGSSGANWCPANLPAHYADSTRGFRLCLPAGLQKSTDSGYPAGTVRFQGFAVPPGTNLVSKQLMIVPGTDPNMQGAGPNGTFKAGGETFKRYTAQEGAAGHSIQSIIYAWTSRGTTVDFDFLLYSANLANFPPSNRPAQFDYAAQVKSTEKIMKTFRNSPWLRMRTAGENR